MTALDASTTGADHYRYTPQKVSHVLRHWEDYAARAQHLAGQTFDAPRVGKHRRSDPLVYADSLADVAQAIALLPADSLERRAVLGVRAGLSMGDVAELAHTRTEHVSDAYERACEAVAEALGWTPDD
jgi:DNA-directed RNA polymerase specialized sigma24 family protein